MKEMINFTVGASYAYVISFVILSIAYQTLPTLELMADMLWVIVVSMIIGAHVDFFESQKELTTKLTKGKYDSTNN